MGTFITNIENLVYMLKQRGRIINSDLLKTEILDKIQKNNNIKDIKCLVLFYTTDYYDALINIILQKQEEPQNNLKFYKCFTFKVIENKNLVEEYVLKIIKLFQIEGDIASIKDDIINESSFHFITFDEEKKVILVPIFFDLHFLVIQNKYLYKIPNDFITFDLNYNDISQLISSINIETSFCLSLLSTII